MPDETTPTPPSALDVLDSRINYLRAELAALDEIILGAEVLIEMNEQGRLTFCTAMAKLGLDELELRVFGFGGRS
jgi:hypothetical protein